MSPKTDFTFGFFHSALRCNFLSPESILLASTMGGDYMNIDEIPARALEIGRFVAATGCTVREAARYFGVSKSTVHKDITVRLRHISPAVYRDAVEVLSKNLAERHIRGGRATMLKYLKAPPK